jgi:hypothetical protein
MKKVSTLGLLMIAAMMSLTAQTTIPNANFEQWTGNKPNGWDASNFQLGFFNIVSVFRDTVDPVQGDACVRIETKTHNLGVASPTIPGIITLGTINVDFTTFTGSVEGGISFTGRPERLKGFIDAAPATGDSAMVAIGFSKWNGTTRDTIGSGLAFFSTVHGEWVAFDIPIIFTTNDVPDSLNIIISSSAIGVDVVVPGSKVYVDSLWFDYGSIMVEVPGRGRELSVWADGGRQLFIRLDETDEFSGWVQVVGLGGNLVYGGRLGAYDMSRGISLQGVADGVYVVRVTLSDGTVYSRKIVLL